MMMVEVFNCCCCQTSGAAVVTTDHRVGVVVGCVGQCSMLFVIAS